MGMVNLYAEATDNPRWRYLTFGMLPLHASGVAAATYHFYYNSPDVAILADLSSGLTFIGSVLLCLASFNIARSNGWNVRDAVNSFSSRGGDGANRYPPSRLMLQQLQLHAVARLRGRSAPGPQRLPKCVFRALRPSGSPKIMEKTMKRLQNHGNKPLKWILPPEIPFSGPGTVAVVFGSKFQI